MAPGQLSIPGTTLRSPEDNLLALNGPLGPKAGAAPAQGHAVADISTRLKGLRVSPIALTRPSDTNMLHEPSWVIHTSCMLTHEPGWVMHT